MRRIAAWLAVLGWAGVIFWGSSRPGSQVPGRFSVVGHLAEYFVFGALIALALITTSNRRTSLVALLSIAVLLASAYGVTDEFHQHFVPGRTPDVADWGLDTLGALAGAMTVVLLRRFRRGRPRGTRR